MFCTECGNKLDAGTRFCPFCGTPVFAAPAAEEAEEVIEEVKKSPEKIVEETAKDAEESLVQEAFEESAEPVIETAESAAEEAADTVKEATEEVRDIVAEEAAEQVEKAVEAVAEPQIKDPEPELKTPEPEARIPEPEVIGSAAAAAQKPASASPETIAMMLAAISLICLFISITKGALVSRIFYIIAAACLTFLAARKEKYPSVLYAVPVCIVALVNVFNSARLIYISITNRYYRYRPAAYSSLYKLILIAVFVMLLLLGVNAVRNKKNLNKVILAGSALLAVYHLVFFFVNRRKGRATVFFNLAMFLFFASYVAICLHFEKTGQDDPEKDFEAEPVTGRAGERRNYSYAGTRTAAPTASAERGPLFGPAAIPSEPVKTVAKADEPATESAPMFAEKPDYIFCIRCGAKLPADSAFCNKCGAPVIG